MALILDGTNGLSDVDGSAATPAIRGSDANTGVFFPAADTIAFAEGGVESMRLDSAGNVGIGTSSPLVFNTTGSASARLLTVYNTGTSATARGEIQVGNAATSSGQIVGGIVFGSGASTTTQNQVASIYATTEGDNTTTGQGNLRFFTSASGSSTERARIDSSGNLLVGTTDSSLTASPGIKFRPSASNADMGIVQNTASNLGAYHLYNTNGTNNGYRFYVTTNGGISNFSGNNVNLSDERTKKNIEVAGGYLDKICAIPVKLFNYKDEVDGEQRTLGVIAQDVEAVAPEFVSNDGWEGAAHEDGGPLKTVYTTDMMFGLMKAIQELNAKVDAQAAEIAALKGQA